VKNALDLALLEWRPEAHSYRALARLSQFASVFRAASSTPALADLLLRRLEWRALEKPADHVEALQSVVATLGGFAPHYHVGTVFGDLFFNDSTDPTLAGQLLVGLLRCEPHRFAAYFRRFLKLRHRIPGAFRDDLLIATIWHVIPEEALLRNLASVGTGGVDYFFRDADPNDRKLVFLKTTIGMKKPGEPPQPIPLGDLTEEGQVALFSYAYRLKLVEGTGADPLDKFSELEFDKDTIH
jgi:hypothetical protein